MKEQHENKDVEEHTAEHHVGEEEKAITKPIIGLLIAAALLILINQFQLLTVSEAVASSGFVNTKAISLSGEKDLANIDLSSLKSTGHTLAAVFPVENIQTADDAIAMLFPTGTPDYGPALEVSFDTPEKSLAVLSRMYPSFKLE